MSKNIIYTICSRSIYEDWFLLKGNATFGQNNQIISLLADSIKALAKLVTIKEIPLEGNDFETPICEEPGYLYEGWMMFEKSNGARN